MDRNMKILLILCILFFMTTVFLGARLYSDIKYTGEKYSSNVNSLIFELDEYEDMIVSMSQSSSVNRGYLENISNNIAIFLIHVELGRIRTENSELFTTLVSATNQAVITNEITDVERILPFVTELKDKVDAVKEEADVDSSISWYFTVR